MSRSGLGDDELNTEKFKKTFSVKIDQIYGFRSFTVQHGSAWFYFSERKLTKDTRKIYENVKIFEKRRVDFKSFIREILLVQIRDHHSQKPSLSKLIPLRSYFCFCHAANDHDATPTIRGIA